MKYFITKDKTNNAQLLSSTRASKMSPTWFYLAFLILLVGALFWDDSKFKISRRKKR